ncbi:MAG: phosphatidylglycerophosphatase A [Desulfobacteraceae bacterium]|jgi:phosphatidylglycerophosphatase A|nr:MAG: phosphatidylglycerophosphatase A [Desulfobacteraceae bacterium]
MADSPGRVRGLWRKTRSLPAGNRIAILISTFFGTGLMPSAPGTFGTAASIPLIFLISSWGTNGKLFFLISLFGLAVWTSGIHAGMVGADDPHEVVIDEVTGFTLAMVFVPCSWLNVTMGFFLFRLFDILKPFPIRMAERLKGGVGIVADDLAAGIYTLTVLLIAGQFVSG